MPSPRCTSHMLSVGEFVPLIKYMRQYYRVKFDNDEQKVSEALVKIMEWLEIKHECCRNMILNMDTRYDFVSRRDAY
jgi:DNA-directed RNA polymerase subunit N (RpoN/RPB10)